MLTEIAADTGLDPEATRRVLASTEHADEVEADVRQAAAYGATGVPFFVVDGRYGISGAQPVDVFSQTLARAWAESRAAGPTMVGTAADARGPDDCAV